MCILPQLKNIKTREKILVKPSLKRDSFLSPNICRNSNCAMWLFEYRPATEEILNEVNHMVEFAYKTQYWSKIPQRLLFPPWKERMSCYWAAWYSPLRFIYKQTVSPAHMHEESTDVCSRDCRWEEDKLLGSRCSLFLRQMQIKHHLEEV